MADYDNDSGANFWGNIGAGILPYCTTSKRFLINLRSQDVNEPGTYGIWGGKLDEDYEDDPKEAAMREFEEETKYKGEIHIEELCVYKTKGFEYHNYLGKVSREFDPDISDCWESDGYEWVTLEEMEDLPNLHFGLRYILDECSIELDDLVMERIIVRFEDFVLENDNFKNSISSLGKFGMMDYSKYPEPLKEKLEESKLKPFKGVDAGYGGTEVAGSVYRYENPDYMISFFLDQVDNPYTIVIDFYLNSSELSAFYKIPWIEFEKAIKFLDEYDPNEFLAVERYFKQNWERKDKLEKIGKKFDIELEEIYT